MKKWLTSVFLVIVCTGCSSLRPSPEKPYSKEHGIAFQVLHIENELWNQEASKAELDKLLGRIEHSIYAKTKRPLGAEELLTRIHKGIKGAGFKIGNTSIDTFGDALVKKDLDCSDLTLIYLEVFEGLRLLSEVVFARNHVFFAVPKETGCTYWETTRGKEVTLDTVAEDTAVATESIAEKAYLVNQPREKILCAVYLEITLKLWRQKADPLVVEKWFKKAISANETMPTPLLNYAVFLCVRERFDEAETLLNRAMELDPNSPDVYDLTSALYQAKGEFKKSLDMCKKAMDRKTANESTMQRYLELSALDLHEAIDALGIGK